MFNMLKVVLSGGPCAGKSTSLSMLERLLTEKLGKKVFTVPETATELILSGFSPADIKLTPKDFQKYCLRKQIQKEKMYDDIVSQYYNQDDVVILYDRGILDQLAYIDKNEFTELLKEEGMYLSDVVNRYDAVIHLVTAALGTDVYTRANNTARLESKEEAIEADRRTLAGNMLHPHVRVIDNSTDFDRKVRRVLDSIFELLGEPKPSEIERKFLIKYPTKEQLSKLDYVTKSEILQTYLKRLDENVERRVRQRGTKEKGYSYYYTEKESINSVKRLEQEEKISVNQYVDLLNEADTELHQIKKTRYCFIYKSQYFELDIYPYSDKYAILEIEISDENKDIELPDYLDIVKEVTDDDNYKNSSIAKTCKLNY